MRAIAPPLPTDFVLHPTGGVTNKIAITALNAGLKSVDDVYRQLDCDRPPCAALARPFAVQIRENRDAAGSISSLDFVKRDNAQGSSESVLGTISDQDMSKLTDDQKVTLVVYEESVQQNYDRWMLLSSQLQTVTGNDKASTAAQLVVAGREMCGNFENILGVLQGINIQVWDHYASINSVCYRFKQAHIGSQP
jgi:hypothetical protein